MYREIKFSVNSDKLEVKTDRSSLICFYTNKETAK